MTIEAEEMQTWVEAEALDPSDEKLGKVAEVDFRDAEPPLVEISSGLAGRKRHLTVLRGARVSRGHIRVAQRTLVPASSTLDHEQLGELSADDDRLRGLAPDAPEAYADRVAATTTEAARRERETLEAEAETARAAEAKR